jgi:hypothetical protein
MILLTQRKAIDSTIELHLEEARAHHVGSIKARNILETEHLARLFVQAPLADQLVREALEIMTTGNLDIRDWLRTAQAHIDTVDGKD